MAPKTSCNTDSDFFVFAMAIDFSYVRLPNSVALKAAPLDLAFAFPGPEDASSRPEQCTQGWLRLASSSNELHARTPTTRDDPAIR